MDFEDDTATGTVATTADEAPVAVGRSAPAVTALVVTHDPGVWFDEVLEAFAGLDYPELHIVVVDAASAEPVAPRVRAVLPDAEVVRLDENRGFGRSIDAALDRIDAAPLLLLAHDDVVPDPGAVRHLVEEVFRSNAAVVGPKTVRWSDPARLLSVGEGADKFGYPVAHVERGELDQEQHDAVRDVFTVPDAFTLVRRDLLDAIGGFDPEGTWFGDDLDLCWRAHVAGGRVMVAPAARVRHVEALGERRPVDDRRRLQFRHRMRTMLGCYSRTTLLRVLPQLFVVHVGEILFALVTGRPGQARDVASAWTWNLARLGSLRRRRAQLREARRIPDAEVRSLQVGGSARIAAFLRGQLSVGEDPLGSAATLSRRLVESVAGPGRRTALVAWLVVGLVVLLGSRHLLTRPIPAIGELVPFPEQITPVLAEWWSSWRRAGLGSEGFAATGDLLAAIGLAGFLGAGGLLRTVLLLGMLPLGLYGTWRLVAPTHSIRASALGLIAYAGVPVGYDSLATGSWRGLVAYGVAPWVIARVVRSSGTAPFGADDPPAGPRTAIPPLWRQTLVLGVVAALAAAVDPLWVVLPFGIVVAMLPGALAAGSLRGFGRMALASLGAGLVALALHGPWAFELLGPDTTWSAITGTSVDSLGPDTISGVLQFDVGPVGSSILNLGMVVGAFYVLLVGRGWRLGWAARAWSVAVVSWGLALAAGRGWLPVAAPAVEVLLAPAGVMVSLAIGLGAAAFDFDVRRRGFSWRQLGGFLALASVLVAFLPAVGAAVGGRWDVPRADLAQSLSFLDDAEEQGSFRVVWFGSPEVLPLGAWPLTDDTWYATTTAGTPELQDLWPGVPEPDDAPLRTALDLALDVHTTRLGRSLAPAGVRYVVVVDQAAPAPYGGVSDPVPSSVVDALEQQLDLVRIELNPAITLYRNAAWAPRPSVLPAGTVPEVSTSTPRDAWVREAGAVDLGSVAEGLEVDGASASGTAASGTELLVGSSPSKGWHVTVDGERARTRSAFGWTSVAPLGNGGEVAVGWTTPVAHRLALAGQVVLALVVAAVLYSTRAEVRDRRRATARRASRAARRAERQKVQAAARAAEPARRRSRSR